mmetsp:Transcript_1621/g.2775  ORF Transcript_1621/g.2775 Transcript_1621/m.2775 type:complete len:257 (-) Transcript_1621:262-1032(-)
MRLLLSRWPRRENNLIVGLELPFQLVLFIVGYAYPRAMGDPLQRTHRSIFVVVQPSDTGQWSPLACGPILHQSVFVLLTRKLDQYHIMLTLPLPQLIPHGRNPPDGRYLIVMPVGIIVSQLGRHLRHENHVPRGGRFGRGRRRVLIPLDPPPPPPRNARQIPPIAAASLLTLGLMQSTPHPPFVLRELIDGPIRILMDDVIRVRVAGRRGEDEGEGREGAAQGVVVLASLHGEGSLLTEVHHGRHRRGSSCRYSRC